MKSNRSTLNKMLAVIPVIMLTTFANVFIGFSTAGIVLIQLIANGVNKYLSLILAIIIVICVHVYIRFNHKIINYIKNSGDSNE